LFASTMEACYNAAVIASQPPRMRFRQRGFEP
jgi:hypothetical protein